MTTGNLTLIILAMLLAQVAVASLLVLYRRTREYRQPDTGWEVPQDVTRLHPATSMPNTGMVASSPAWEGFREFSVQRREFEDANRSICSFYLVPLDDKPLPAFRPGQFLTVRLMIQHPLTHENKVVVRCYSLSDAPRPDYYRLSIKRVPAPRGRLDVPPGLSSNFFHDHVREGSHLMVKAPSGHFHLNEDESQPIVLIGGGIGITPMMSILNSVLERCVKREVWLYYGVRNGTEHIKKEQLQMLDVKHDNFHLHVCYSAPNENDVEGIDYRHSSRVDIPLLRNTLKLMRYQFYICGPKPMMESLVPGLEEWGVDPGDIYYESFGPASLKRNEKTTPLAVTSQPVTVTFSQSGNSIPWDPTADTLLEFAESNGIDVESGCRAGSCGSCRTALSAGEVEYSQEPGADIETGYCLLCIAKPRGDLILEV